MVEITVHVDSSGKLDIKNCRGLHLSCGKLIPF